jgi:hypothetical protein
MDAFTLLTVALDPHEPRFREATDRINEDIKSHNPDFLEALVSLLDVETAPAQVVFTALSQIRLFVESMGSANLAPHHFQVLFGISWRFLSDEFPAARRQASTLLASLILHAPPYRDPAHILPLFRELDALAPPAVSGRLETINILLTSMPFPPDYATALTDIGLNLIRSTDDVQILQQCLRMVSVLTPFYSVLSDPDQAPDIFAILFRFYQIPDLTLTVINFWTQVRDIIPDSVLETFLHLSVADLTAIDESLKAEHPLTESTRAVAIRLLLFWESLILDHPEGLAIADRLFPTLLSLISGITDASVANAATEFEPFLAAQSCLRAAMRRDCGPVLPPLLAYVSEFGDSADAKCREASTCLMRTIIADCPLEFLSEIASECLDFVARRVGDDWARAQDLAVQCLGALGSRLGVGLLAPFIDVLFAFVEAALPTASSALRLLRNLAFDAQFAHPGPFLERLAGRLLAVSDPVVLCDVARAFGFAVRHADVAPRAVEILDGFLEHCDSMEVPGLDDVVGAACESLCLLAAAFPPLVLESGRLLQLASSLFDRLKVVNALVLIGFFIPARLDDLPDWLALFRAVVRSGAPEEIDSLLAPFTVLLPLVEDPACFDEMISLLLAISATASSLSVLASVIAACDFVVKQASEMATRRADGIFAIVYRVCAKFRRLELEDVGVEPCRDGLRLLMWVGVQMNAAEAMIRLRFVQCACVFVRLLIGNDEAERPVRTLTAMLIQGCPAEMEQLMNSGTDLGMEFQRIAQMPDEEQNGQESGGEISVE